MNAEPIDHAGRVYEPPERELQQLPQWSRRPATQARGTRRVKTPAYRKGRRKGYVTTHSTLRSGTIIVTPKDRPDLLILRRKGSLCKVRYAAAPKTGTRWVKASKLTGLPAVRL